MSTLWDIHTLPSAGLPVRHYQAYPDQVSAQRMAGHLVGIVGGPLAAEAVDSAVWVARLLGREVAG